MYHFATAVLLQQFVVGVGDEFDLTDTASFDPTTFTRCLYHHGKSENQDHVTC